MKPTSLPVEPNLFVLIQAQLSDSFFEVSLSLNLAFAIL